MTKQLVLASQSPRRKELLSQLGREFTCLSPDIDESELAGEQPEDYVLRLALEKAQAGRELIDSSCWVLGSDTCVVIDGQILGKPADYEDCLATLLKLSGRSHQVYTAVALVNAEQQFSVTVNTEVSFAHLNETAIADYWQSGEPQDKAGSYGIQGIGGKFVKSIKGSFSAVVGLPLYETEQLLLQASL